MCCKPLGFDEGISSHIAPQLHLKFPSFSLWQFEPGVYELRGNCTLQDPCINARAEERVLVTYEIIVYIYRSFSQLVILLIEETKRLLRKSGKSAYRKIPNGCKLPFQERKVLLPKVSGRKKCIKKKSLLPEVSFNKELVKVFIRRELTKGERLPRM